MFPINYLATKYDYLSAIKASVMNKHQFFVTTHHSFDSNEVIHIRTLHMVFGKGFAVSGYIGFKNKIILKTRCAKEAIECLLGEI